jgi:hypothetical protein
MLRHAVECPGMDKITPLDCKRDGYPIDFTALKNFKIEIPSDLPSENTQIREHARRHGITTPHLIRNDSNPGKLKQRWRRYPG